jgi:hypothetical protein
MHSALIDYKWRDKMLLDIDDDIDDNGIYVENTRLLTIREHEKLMYKYTYSPSTLKEYLLGKEEDFYKVKYNTSTLEEIFDVFISPLIQNWENLKRTYETLLIEEREHIFEYKKSLSKVD